MAFIGQRAILPSIATRRGFCLWSDWIYMTKSSLNLFLSILENTVPKGSWLGMPFSNGSCLFKKTILAFPNCSKSIKVSAPQIDARRATRTISLRGYFSLVDADLQVRWKIPELIRFFWDLDRLIMKMGQSSKMSRLFYKFSCDCIYKTGLYFSRKFINIKNVKRMEDWPITPSIWKWSRFGGFAWPGGERNWREENLQAPQPLARLFAWVCFGLGKWTASAS